MKKLNKAIAIALSAVTVLSASSVVPITANAKVTNVVSSSATSNKSGKWGSNAKWSYNSKTRTLTITGKGALKELFDTLPYKIDHIVIKEGITVIKEYALSGYWPEDITFPTSLKEIQGMFFATDSLDNPDEPNSVHSYGITFYGEYGSYIEVYCKNRKGNDLDEEYWFRGSFEPINKSKNRTSGACGISNVNWKLDKNGKMTISGKGNMYSKPATQTFDKSKVKEVVVGNGVTGIVNDCFKDYPKLDIENPIIRINTAFKGCSSLEKISVLPRIYHN